MDVRVGGFPMGVVMFMFLAVGMNMDMFVRFIFNGSMKAPDEIGQPESDQQPGGQTPPEGLDPLDPEYRHSQGYTDETDNHRTQHMTQSTQEGYKKRLGKSPSSGATDHDKRQVMVRTQQCVHKSDGGGGPG
jgi:hypothetical protein